MTGIQTIHVSGLGGSAELRGPVLHVDYQPGAFELCALATCAAGCAIALLAAGVGYAAGLGGHPGLGLVCNAAGVTSLFASFASWRSAVTGLLGRGARRVQLSRGLVEEGDVIRHLRDARVVLERAGMPGVAIVERLSLHFDEGHVVLLVQGGRARIAPFVHALRHAPATRPEVRRAA